MCVPVCVCVLLIMCVSYYLALDPLLGLIGNTKDL